LAKNHIITFGGAYSNHIIATAAAGKLFGFNTTGIIRGEEPKELSHTLQQAKAYAMELIFIDREHYRNKELRLELGKRNEAYVIDEGGYGQIGVRGAAEILNYCRKENYSHIACATGTATMLAGLIKAALPKQETIGISVLRNNFGLEYDLFDLLMPEERTKKMRLVHDYHFGGYAKYSGQLLTFMNELYKILAMPTDFVYTAKLFYAILDMIKNNLFAEGSSILVIHSGGVQGNLSLKRGTLIF
jgi:1-aminocyclopropane-1-carboxylate deaminase